MEGSQKPDGHVLSRATHASLPLASPSEEPTSESLLSEAHSSPMSGSEKSWVLGPSPGGTQALGSRSPGLDSRGFRGLPDKLLPPLLLPPMRGSGGQTPEEPGDRAKATRCEGELPALQLTLEGAGGRASSWDLTARGLLGKEMAAPPLSATRLSTETRG